MVKLAAKFVMIAAVIVGLISVGWAEDTDAGKSRVSIQLWAVSRRGCKGKRSVQRGAETERAAFVLDRLAKRNDA